MAKTKKRKTKANFDEKNLLSFVIKDCTHKDISFIIQSLDDESVDTLFKVLDKWSNYNIFSENPIIDEGVANYLYRMYISSVSDIIRAIRGNKKFLSLSMNMEHLNVEEAEEYINELEICKISIKKILQKFIEVLKGQDLDKGPMGYFISCVPVNVLMEYKDETDFDIRNEGVESSLFFLLKKIAVYLFYILFKPNNYEIKSFKFDSNYDFKIIYGSRKIISDSLIGEYVNKKKTLHSMECSIFRDEAEYETRISTIIHDFFEQITKYMFFDDENIKAIILDRNTYNMPFFDLKYTSSKLDDSVDLNLETSIDLAKVFKQRELQKYAMPRDGCILVFLREDTLLTEAFIKDLGDEYIFEVKFRKGAFKYEDNTNVEKAKFYINKESLYSIFESCLNGLENGEFLKDSTLGYYHNKSAYITFSDNLMATEFSAAINLVFSCCLYCALVNLSESEVKLYNVHGNETSRLPHNNASYKTAYIRRLPNGYNASIEAKERAALLNVIVPTGFTFVREHIPEDNKAEKTLNIAL